MEVSRIISEIDAQISKLQQARALLAGTTAPAVRTGPGRPKGGSKKKKAASSGTGNGPSTQERKLSAEGRKRIADAMKKRWAERRKQSSKS